MAKKKYGRRRVGSGRNISLLGAGAGAALVLSIMARGNGQFQNAGSPIGFLKEGKWDSAASAAGKNLTDAGTYLPMILPLGVLIGMKLFHVKGRVSKHVSIA